MWSLHVGHKSTVDLSPEQAMENLRIEFEDIERRFAENPNDEALHVGLAVVLEAMDDCRCGGPDMGSYNYRVFR